MTFLSNLNWRFATQKFNNQKVEGEHIVKIFDAIRMAPSSFGLQPFHVLVITDENIKAQLLPMVYNQAQVTSCSHLFVFCSRTDLDSRIESYFDLKALGNESNREALRPREDFIKNTFKGMEEPQLKSWATKQAYIALGFALAACAELQVDSCPMEGFDAKGFRDALQLPNHTEPAVLLAVGYREAEVESYGKIRFGAEDLFTLK